jgi:hypothetical protein
MTDYAKRAPVEKNSPYLKAFRPMRHQTNGITAKQEAKENH